MIKNRDTLRTLRIIAVGMLGENPNYNLMCCQINSLGLKRPTKVSNQKLVPVVEVTFNKSTYSKRKRPIGPYRTGFRRKIEK